MQPTLCEILYYRNGTPGFPSVLTQWWDASNNYYGTFNIDLPIGINGSIAFEAAAVAAAVAFAPTQGWTGITSANCTFAFVKPSDLPTSNTPVLSSDTQSIVTGTGATGFQISTTRNAVVAYNIQIVSTASIAGNASGTVVLEVCPTNSATAADWIEVGRFTNAQALSLAITLQSVQTLVHQLTYRIPAGYYAKLRSLTPTGTVSYSFVSGSKLLL